MDYYNEIKNELIDNEINKKVKDYSKNKYELEKYYNVGKLLAEAGKHYGDGVLKEYSKRLQRDIGKKYSLTTLKYIRQFYLFSKSHSLSDLLSFTHYRCLLSLKNRYEINYYIEVCKEFNLSVRDLQRRIKSKEYDRLPEETKNKLLNKEENKIEDFIKNPIMIKNPNNIEVIKEKMLQKLIMENIPSFLKELGSGFTFIDNEYKIKLGDRYNYIDFLLFNYEYNCFVVIELKVGELKKEYIGQIEIYMNYINDNLRKIGQGKTIGIIICREDNNFIIKYCSDKRIIARGYELV